MIVFEWFLLTGIVLIYHSYLQSTIELPSDQEVLLFGQYRLNDDNKKATASQQQQQQYENTNGKITVVIRSTGGRLGNNMFQYASSLAIVQDMQQTAKYKTKSITICMHPDFGLPLLEEAVVGPFIPKCSSNLTTTSSSYYEIDDLAYGMYHEINLPPCILTVGDGTNKERQEAGCSFALKGYYQSWKYFDKYQATVRKAFQFKPAIQQQAHEYAINYLSTAPIHIGIHIRKGDMANNDFYLRDPPLSYYQRAMDHFADTYGSIHYFVVSDDPDWCAQQSIFFSNGNAISSNSANTVTIVRHDHDDSATTPSSAALDMAILSQCHHVVMSRGSFGWWAAYLTASKAIYYKDMFVLDHTENLGKVKLEDHYPPHWVGLGA
jgi:hypothetical protein